jgi:hypothetical protein
MKDANKSAFDRRQSSLGKTTDPIMKQLASWNNRRMPEDQEGGKRKKPFGNVKEQLREGGGMFPPTKVKGKYKN